MAKEYHLKPGDDGEWRVESKGGKNALRITDTKSEARDYAREVARNQEANLVVYTKSGRKQNEFNYAD